MNTNLLKKFAQEARRILMTGVIQRLNFWGFDNKGNLTDEPIFVPGGMLIRGEPYDVPDAEPKWKALQKAIRNHGYKNIVEEAAYTWFNRLMAIRILAKNDFDTPQLEYGEDGMNTPLILRRARAGNMDFLTAKEQENLRKILTDYDKEFQSFSVLITSYCKQHKLLGNVFGRLNDYTELLLPSNILEENGFIHLINTSDSVSDDDYRSPELIGWLYQFYISEKKDEVFASFKKNKKAEAEDIPAATQIFTPNWIVKYMVENTAGKIWLDEKPNSKLRSKMKYLVETPQTESPAKENTAEINQQTSIEALSPSRGGDAEGRGGRGKSESESGSDEQYSLINADPQNLKLLDPACGSGHILVEGFDLLYEMYMEDFYTPGEATESILKNNLFGLDIDLRAAQLTKFAILLKAASKEKSILDKGILPRVYAMPEKDNFDRAEVRQFLGSEGERWEDKLFSALQLMQDAQNLGSVMILDVPKEMFEFLKQRIKTGPANDLQAQAIFNKMRPFLDVLLILADKYEVLVTNPPYMGLNNINEQLIKYLENYYWFSRHDLSNVFINVCLKLNVARGHIGMINQQSWMFAKSYIELRKYLLGKVCLISCAHLGPHAFPEIKGEVVQTVAFILVNESNKQNVPLFIRLVDFLSSSEKEKQFFNESLFFSSLRQSDFEDFEENKLQYGVYKPLVSLIKNKDFLKDDFETREGLTTGDNEIFLRYFYEVSKKKFNKKWFFHVKGGDYRKWYGNLEIVVNWENSGFEIKNNSTERGRIRSHNYNEDYIFKEGFTWGSFGRLSSFRFVPKGHLFDSSGSMGFNIDGNIDELYFAIAYLNSKIVQSVLPYIKGNNNAKPGHISLIPYIGEFFKTFESNSQVLIKELISLSKIDWDSRETSWGFQKSPLLGETFKLEQAYKNWLFSVTNNFFHLHNNEEKLNRIFINIYDLQDDLAPDVPLKDITILQEELDRNKLEQLEPIFREKGKDAIELPIDKAEVMRQFVSYAVGCFMGRYRLDKPGLNIAHPDPDEEELSSYQYNAYTFEIDDDAIIPLMTRDCAFPDNGVERVKQFIEIIWGEDTLTENMNFLEECLGTSLETYMYRNFWKDHCKRYKKRPIYWLFASKSGAFQVLVYMHRMNRHTVEKIRSLYLLPHIKFLENQVALLEQSEGSLSAADARRLDKFRKDLDDCIEYDLRLKDVADKQIEFDLDDGVKVNYGLFGNVVREIK